MPIKSGKMRISKNKKLRFFLMSQASLNPNIRFLDQKVCPVATDTHRQTDTQSDYWGHPFRLSGFFPSTYHQGSAQKSIWNVLGKKSHIFISRMCSKQFWADKYLIYRNENCLEQFFLAKFRWKNIHFVKMS